MNDVQMLNDDVYVNRNLANRNTEDVMEGGRDGKSSY